MKPPIHFNRLESDAVVQKPVFGNALTPNGSPTYSTGYFGDAYDGASNDYLKFNAVDYWTNPDNPGTIEYWWFVPSGWTPSHSSFHVQLLSTSPGSNYGLIRTGATIAGGGGLKYNYAETDVGDPFSYILPSASISKNAWHHVAICWDTSGIDGGSNTIRGYFDGTVVGSSNSALTYSNDWTTPDGFSILGSDTVLNNYNLEGKMDNVKFYDYAKIDFNDRWAERGGLNDMIN